MNKTETITLVTEPPAGPAAEGSHVVLVAALLMLLSGTGLAIAGVHHLLGLGWALLAAAPTPVALAAILFKGLTRGG